MPEVSVIIPVRDGAAHLERALESVLRQPANLELVVVDDGSVDGTAAIARRFPQVKYLYQERMGVARARNRGLREARGELLAFLDADDLWLEDKLKKQVELLRTRPELDVCVTLFRYECPEGEAPPAGFQVARLGQALLGRIPSTLLVRRAAYDRIGGFDESLSTAEDVDWFARAQDAGARLGIVDEVLVLKRLESNSASSSVVGNTARLLSVLRRSVQRRSSPTPSGSAAGGRAATVSAIVPLFEGRAYLREALASMVQQTRPPDEILVVDDGSSDGGVEIATEFPGVRAIRQEHAGQAAALNRGVEMSRGEYLTFLDADDRWTVGKIEAQLRAFEAAADLDMVFGFARQFVEPRAEASNSSTEPQPVRPCGPLLRRHEVLPARLPSALMVRRSAFERVGPFSTRHTLGSVVEWCARAADVGLETLCLDEILYERRIHDRNTGVTRRGDREEYGRMLKATIDRRREARGVR